MTGTVTALGWTSAGSSVFLHQGEWIFAGVFMSAMANRLQTRGLSVGRSCLISSSPKLRCLIGESAYGFRGPEAFTVG